MTARRFELVRDVDITGVSGTGVVAEGVAFTDGVVCLHWVGAWPSSIVHYDRGIEAVEHVHGHGGNTRIVWLDDDGDAGLDTALAELEQTARDNAARFAGPAVDET